MTGAFLCYKGSSLGIPLYMICKHFGLKTGYNYEIEITEGGKYYFSCEENLFIHIHKRKMFLPIIFGHYIGLVCKDKFEKLFFEPKKKQGYSIKVKRI